MIKPLLFASSVVLFAIAASSAAGPAAQESAQAPPPTMKNPVKSTPQTRARAKEIYNVDCALCHGENGNGKTSASKAMELSLGDWTNPKTLAATVLTLMRDQAATDAQREGFAEVIASLRPAEGDPADQAAAALLELLAVSPKT